MKVSSLVVQYVLLDILYAPFWWYTRGLVMTLKIVGDSFLFFDVRIGFSLWLKNIGVPLYGQTDIVGRLFSFLLRLVNIIIRGALLGVVAIVHLCFIALWIGLPIYIIQLVF